METSPGQGAAMPNSAPFHNEEDALQPPLPAPTVADLILALALLVIGFLFWDWDLILTLYAGFGTTVIFLATIAISFAFLQVKGIKQNGRSLLLLAVAVAGALPFALNGERFMVNFLLILFEIAACLLWLAYSCRSQLSQRITAVIIGDLFNQFIIVPFANFLRFFSRPFLLLRNGGRNSGPNTTSTDVTRTKKPWVPLLFAILGLIACIPVFALVISLLSSADDGFYFFIKDLSGYLERLDLAKYTLQLILGIPITAYIFGALIGNTFQRHTAHLSEQGLLQTFHKAHALPKAAIYLPLSLFALLYIVFFITLGNYLFLGLQGQLPVTYTYAEYARDGFFQLCGVATINLVILALTWLLAKRSPRSYPLPLRLLSGLLALLTCLLIVTAASKLLLYIQVYSLTPLRLYVSWFLLLMLLVFALLVAWHIRPFNVARPIIALIFAFTLTLGLANTNGIIANYNADRYLSAQTDRIDVYLYEDLGDAGVDALYRLEQNAPEKDVREKAGFILSCNRYNHECFVEAHDTGLTTLQGWQAKSLQHLRAQQLHSQHS
ncbi:MAG: DUF4173 domain-containing protein [Coriobacteriia bacterium]|nr:DUF4173 domain-containing protein [Coriobacteriia bacterium]